MKKKAKLLTVYLSVIAFIFIFLLCLDFYSSMKKGRRLNTQYESIKYGDDESELYKKMGKPNSDFAAGDTLHAFFGNAILPEEKQGKIARSCTYKATPITLRLIGFDFSEYWQFGIDKNGKVVAKHYY